MFYIDCTASASSATLLGQTKCRTAVVVTIMTVCLVTIPITFANANGVFFLFVVFINILEGTV